MRLILAIILSSVIQIAPQEGFQMKFLRSPADIVIGGSGAGVGKSFALLLDPARHSKVKGFNGVIFRRHSTEVKQAGGLWDTSQQLYRAINGTPKDYSAEWVFDSGAKIKFSHLQYEKDKFTWQGSQITYIGFDELTHFSKSQFFYLLTRNRSTCGVRPYIRATCNPDPDSWLIAEGGIWGKGFVGWWIDPETGKAIPERQGVLRYFTLDSDKYVWGNTAKEVIDQVPHVFEKLDNAEDLIKSVTFIAGSIFDNKKLLSVDQGYLANLHSQDDATKAALLDGNWKVRNDDDLMIPYESMQNALTSDFVGKDGQGNILEAKRYITADIALQGSDRLVILVWHGWRCIDVKILDKADPRQVVDIIEDLAIIHKVPRSQIAYDSDGLGTYLRGYLSGARAFVNNQKAFSNEKYKNLKTQCAYKVAERFNANEVYFTPMAATYKLEDGRTFAEVLVMESRCLKRDDIYNEKYMSIIPKEKMKLINGRSPDVLDAVLIRAFFDVQQPHKLII
jgi:hypothetical protein